MVSGAGKSYVVVRGGVMLQEEMHRVLGYFLWHAGWWSELAVINRHGLSNVSQEGIAAYAYKQAYHQMALRSKFNLLWRDSSELEGDQ